MFGTLTLLILILAVIITAQNITKENKNKSETSMFNPPSTQTPAPSSSPTDIPTVVSSIPTPTPTLTPTPTPNNDSQSVLDFKYPNSIIISQNEKEAIFESTDNPKTITDWYKDKIKSMNMNVTTFVQTSTNNNILNKLVGADKNKEIRVEISKQNNNAVVKIVVVSN